MKHSRQLSLLFSLTLMAPELEAQTKKSVSDGVVAMIGDRPVTEAQVDEIAKERLARLRAEEYNIRKLALEEYINRALVEKEAAARGVSPEELVRREIEGRVAPVTEDQKRAVYESMPQAYAGKSEAEAFAQIEQNLKNVRVTEARRRFYSGLREKAGVRVLLEPPRVAVDASSDPAKGPKDAPVTLVEFADFQCPACRGASQTVRRLQERYAGKLRVVYRDFPLPMHKQAPKAAEAGECAHEQGKFWEMHDKLFENQGNLQVADLKQRASELGLDGARFTACLDSGKYAAEWQQDMSDGRRYGVSATPTFFINGRLVQGGRPETLAEIIEEELARSAPATAGGGARR